MSHTRTRAAAHTAAVLRALLCAVLCALTLAPGVQAQTTCRPPAGSNEATLLALYAVPLGFASALPAPALGVGEVAIALEATYLPSPGTATRRTDACFLAKTQNSALSPVLPRPRVAIGLPHGFTAEVSYLPPVTVVDATPNLLGLALSYGAPVTGTMALLARVHATVGHVNGAITCDTASLQPDPAQPCFGAQPSNDRYAPNVYGAELLSGVQLGAGWRGVAGAGLLHARPRFQVGFTNGFDVLDNTRVAINVTRATGTLGVARRLSSRVDAGLLGYGVLGDGATVRLTGQWRVR